MDSSCNTVRRDLLLDVESSAADEAASAWGSTALRSDAVIAVFAVFLVMFGTRHRILRGSLRIDRIEILSAIMRWLRFQIAIRPRPGLV